MISIEIPNIDTMQVKVNGEIYTKLNAEAISLRDSFNFEAPIDSWKNLSCSDIHDVVYGYHPKSRSDEIRYALNVLSTAGLSRTRSGYLMPPVKKEEISLEDVDL